jgi:hypothetical protein
MKRPIGLSLTLAGGLAILAGTSVLALTPPTPAQAQTTPRAKPAKGRGHKPAEAAAKPDAGAPMALVRPSKGGDAGPGEVVAQKLGDGGTRVFRFGEMEIEGRLKNPQLVFFLRRVRAEFAAGTLGHRSFMPELERTRQDPSL